MLAGAMRGEIEVSSEPGVTAGVLKLESPAADVDVAGW